MGQVALLLDSDVLIHALNGTRQSATDLLSRQENFAISIVAWMEVMVGSTAEDQTWLRDFLGYFRVIDISMDIAEQCVKVRKSSRLKLPDALIYATALATNRTLVSFNRRDFPEDTPSVLLLR